jgi:hypothetical protein
MFLTLKLEIALVNRTDICCRAIKRTFANLYGVSTETVDVSWTTGKAIVVQCAGKNFLHPILSDPDVTRRSSLASTKTLLSST